MKRALPAEEGSLEWFIQTEKQKKENLPLDPPTKEVVVKKDEEPESGVSFSLDFGTLLAMKKKTCENIINILFFSEMRTIVYIHKERELQMNLAGALKSYYQNQIQSGIPLNFMHAFTHILNVFTVNVNVVDGPRRVVQRTPRLKRNEQFMKYVIDVIMEQFSIIMNVSPWGQKPENRTKICVKFENFALAVLSCVKRTDKKIKFEHGNEVHDFTIIPQIPFAVEYTPPTTDFGYYGFNKNAVTDGTNIITDAYKSFKTEKVKFPVELFKNSKNEFIC